MVAGPASLLGDAGPQGILGVAPVRNVETVDVSDSELADADDDEMEPSAAYLGLEVDVAVANDSLPKIQTGHGRQDADEGRPLHRLATAQLGGGRIDAEHGSVRIEPQNRRRIEVREGWRFRYGSA